MLMLEPCSRGAPAAGSSGTCSRWEGMHTLPAAPRLRWHPCVRAARGCGSHLKLLLALLRIASTPDEKEASAEAAAQAPHKPDRTSALHQAWSCTLQHGLACGSGRLPSCSSWPLTIETWSADAPFALQTASATPAMLSLPSTPAQQASAALQTHGVGSRTPHRTAQQRPAALQVFCLHGRRLRLTQPCLCTLSACTPRASCTADAAADGVSSLCHALAPASVQGCLGLTGKQVHQVMDTPALCLASPGSQQPACATADVLRQRRLHKLPCCTAQADQLVPSQNCADMLTCLWQVRNSVRAQEGVPQLCSMAACVGSAGDRHVSV